MILWEHLRLFFGGLVLLSGIYYVKAWTYHYNIDEDMNWTTARQWCQKHFTDMVAIQNQEEVTYLNTVLPFNRAYYWIGIRKIDGHWTWVGTKKQLVPEAANWATNEPNNQGTGEDCVEIYIKRIKDTAKWNDERCSKKKAALCYLASCSEKSCSEHAECVETIGDYTCQCEPGFMGPRCDEAIKCQPITNDPGGWRVNCTHPFSTYSFNSSCEFKCEEGFELKGSDTTWCDHTGHWTQNTPTCTAQQCSHLSDPPHGNVTCTHPHGQFNFGTVCDVSCQTGFILHGTPRIQCSKMGKWTDTPPYCLAQQCPPLAAPENGWMNCSHPNAPFSYGSQCFLRCEPGFKIIGESGMECSASGNWNQNIPSCTAVCCEPFTLSHLPELGPPPSMNCSHPHGNFSFGSQCVFQCPESLELNGTSQLICTSSGYWTSSPPSCVVKEMSVGAGMLMFAAVGAASSAGLLLFGGIIVLLMRQFSKKARYSLNDSSEEGDLNPGFELN